MSAMEDHAKGPEAFIEALRNLQDRAETDDERAYYTIAGRLYAAFVNAFRELKAQGVDQETMLQEASGAAGYAIYMAMSPGFHDGTWPEWLPDIFSEASEAAMAAASRVDKRGSIQ